jgi:hypothetical protein
MTTNIGDPLELLSLALCGALGKLRRRWRLLAGAFQRRDAEKNTCGENLSLLL